MYFSIPSQQCVTMHFYGPSYCDSIHTDYSNSYFKSIWHRIITQNISHNQNHLIYRHDKVYIYPSLRIMNSVQNQYNLQNNLASHDLVSIKYVYIKDLKFSTQEQGSYSNQRPHILKKIGCVYVLQTPHVYVPILSDIKSVTLPSVSNLDTQYSFSFHGNDYPSWSKASSSWVISTLCHINCSKPIAFNICPQDYIIKVLNMCNESRNLGIKIEQDLNICLYPSPDMNGDNITNYILEMHIPSIMKYNGRVGTLTVKSVWRNLCPKTRSIDMSVFDNTSSVSSTFYHESKDPLKCAELVVTSFVHSSSFDKYAVYSNEMTIAEFKEAELMLTKKLITFLLSYKFKFIIQFEWHKIPIFFDNQNYGSKYKLFYNKSLYSWMSALNVCNQSKMILPIFENKKHLDNVLSYVFKSYGFLPFGLFVGLYNAVSFKHYRCTN